MRFPSLDRILAAARSTARRFPFVVAAATVAAAGAVAAVDGATGREDLSIRLLVSGSLGIPLFFALRLTAETRRWGRRVRGAGALAAAAGLTAFAWLWGGWSETEAMTRYLHLSAGFHLLAAWLPFAGRGGVDAFWKYDERLLLRFLTGGFYAAVLFLGLALALAGLDNLLGVDVEAVSAYPRLFFLLALVFHPWFFLAGVPRSVTALEGRPEHPAGLEVFARWILFPIVVVYLAILTAYLGRILVLGEWPSGWIGWLVSGVSVLGILTLLLTHPLRARPQNTWARLYGRGFFVALLPALAMLGMAAWKRIDQYGITERRYFLAAGTLWLVGLSAWWIAGRTRDLRGIPASLALIVLLTFAGPWSAYSVSEASQRGRLERLLTRNRLLGPEGGVRVEGPVPDADRREIGATLRYLVDTHGFASVDRWFDPPPAEAVERTPRPAGPSARPAGAPAPERPGEAPPEPAAAEPGEPRPEGAPTRPAARVDTVTALLTGQLGLPLPLPGPPGGPDRILHLSADPAGGWVDISGYDYAFPVRGELVVSAVVGGDTLRLAYRAEEAVLRLLRNGEALVGASLEPLVARAREAAAAGRVGELPADALALEAVSGEAALRVRFRSLSLRARDGGWEVIRADADAYVRLP